MYTIVMLIWLTNVHRMLPLAWIKHWLIEALPSKISIPSTFPFPLSLPPMLFRKPCFYYFLFFSFSHSLFCFKLYKISNDSTPVGILWLVGWSNITDSKLVGINHTKLLIQCHNLKYLRSRNWLYAIFIRKTKLEHDFLNFSILGSSEYEKNGHFFITVKFCFTHKKYFKTINI